MSFLIGMSGTRRQAAESKYSDFPETPLWPQGVGPSSGKSERAYISMFFRLYSTTN